VKRGRNEDTMKLIVALLIILVGFFSVTYASTLTGTGLAVTDDVETTEVNTLQPQAISSRDGLRATSPGQQTITLSKPPTPSTSRIPRFDDFFAYKTEQEREQLRQLIEEHKNLNPEQALQLRLNQLNGQQQDVGVLE